MLGSREHEVNISDTEPIHTEIHPQSSPRYYRLSVNGGSLQSGRCRPAREAASILPLFARSLKRTRSFSHVASSGRESDGDDQTRHSGEGAWRSKQSVGCRGFLWRSWPACSVARPRRGSLSSPGAARGMSGSSGATSAWAFFYVALRVVPVTSALVKWTCIVVVGAIGLMAALGPLMNGTDPARALAGAAMVVFAACYARIPTSAIKADLDAVVNE